MPAAQNDPIAVSSATFAFLLSSPIPKAEKRLNGIKPSKGFTPR